MTFKTLLLLKLIEANTTSTFKTRSATFTDIRLINWF